MPAIPVWTIHESNAELQCGSLHAHLDLTRPEAGLQRIEYGGKPYATSHWLGCPLPGTHDLAGRENRECRPAITEVYVRQHDLVVHYQVGALFPRIGWRLFLHSPMVIGVELLLSMQTTLLDSSPLTSVCTSAPCEQVGWQSLRHNWSWRSAEEFGLAGDPLYLRPPQAGMILCRLDDRVSYGQAIFPSDFLQAQIHRNSEGTKTVELTTPLIADRLEKGVIRCARVRGWWMPRQDDTICATQLFEEFASSPPPLTT